MRALLAAAAAVLLAACTTGSSEDRPAPAESPSTAVSPEPSTPATPSQPRPRVGECRALGFEAAVAPVSPVDPRSCRDNHTAQTFHVGRLDLDHGGHRLAVDSPAVQDQPAKTCRARLPRHLGVSQRELRLSMARTVWFTPSVEDAATGADWFRCDVVVVASPERLLPLPRRTAGLGDDGSLAMCGTAEPGTRSFTRVACARRHSWRAVATVDLPGESLPSAQQVAGLMTPACRSAARARAADPLDFTWSEERPTEEQWEAGQHYGICWVPDRG